MIGDEYTYVYLEGTREGFGKVPFWVDTSNPPDGKDALAKKACEKVLVLDWQQTNASSDAFQAAVIDNAHKWPIYCDDCPTTGNASWFASILTDSFYIYAKALNKTIEQVGPSGVRNGTLLATNSAGQYTGVTGQINISKGGGRQPVYQLYALNLKREQQMYAVTTCDLDSPEQAYYTPLYADESELWAIRGGKRPLSHPLCGFDGSECPLDFWAANYLYVVIGAILFVLAALAFLALFFGMWRSRRREMRRLNGLWQIPYDELIRRDEKSELAKSYRSIRSGMSMSTKSSIIGKADTEKTLFCFYRREAVVARNVLVRVSFTKEHEVELRY
ncbi:Protein GCY-22 a, partial [Aphelenchoides avenae]